MLIICKGRQYIQIFSEFALPSLICCEIILFIQFLACCRPKIQNGGLNCQIYPKLDYWKDIFHKIILKLYIHIYIYYLDKKLSIFCLSRKISSRNSNINCLQNVNNHIEWNAWKQDFCDFLIEIFKICLLIYILRNQQCLHGVILGLMHFINQ